MAPVLACRWTGGCELGSPERLWISIKHRCSHNPLLLVKFQKKTVSANAGIPAYCRRYSLIRRTDDHCCLLPVECAPLLPDAGPMGGPMGSDGRGSPIVSGVFALFGCVAALSILGSRKSTNCGATRPDVDGGRIPFR